VSQRLVRRLCDRCKKQGDRGGYEAVGCPACLGTGFHGRTLIAEMIQLDGELRKAILAKADLDKLETLLKTKGHAGILENGRTLVESGVTTTSELHKACGVVAQGETQIDQE